MELLICMSIAGSIPVVICLLLYIIQRDNYNYILGRRLLLTGLFFYLVPVQLVKYLIPRDAFLTFMLSKESQLYLSGSLSFWSERRGEYVWMPNWFNIVAKLWMVGIIIFAIYQIIKYWKGAHSIKNYIFDKVEDTEDNLIYYLIPDGICGPCTVGLFRQKIAVPENFPLLHPDFIMVYKHEHTHLKNHDNLVKLLCLLVLCLHWMNPVAYLLLYLYIDTAEIVSDSVAVDGCTKEKRQDYATLLVLEASTSDIFPVVWKNNLSGHKDTKNNGKNMKVLKRRINYMMKEKKKGLLQRGIMVSVSALTVIASAGTVMAYEPMQWSDGSFDETIWSDESEYAGYVDSDIIVGGLKFSECDGIFIGDDGNIVYVFEDDIDTHILCTHSMVNGYFYTHKSNSSGGCTLTVYTCQRCEKCGYLANKKYSHTVTSTKCTH